MFHRHLKGPSFKPSQPASHPSAAKKQMKEEVKNWHKLLTFRPKFQFNKIVVNERCMFSSFSLKR